MIRCHANCATETQFSTLSELVFVIGRQADCHFIVDDPTVSSVHARVTWQAGRYLLEDLGSSNGTWLNGKKVSSVWIDDAVCLVFGRVSCELQVLDPVFFCDLSGTFRMATQSVMVGRASDNDWVINHPTVSSWHFNLQYDGDLVHLRNHSRQEVWVGGLPVVETTLVEGDDIQVGEVNIMYVASAQHTLGVVFDPAIVAGSSARYQAELIGALSRDQADKLAAYLHEIVGTGATHIDLNLHRCQSIHPRCLDVLIQFAQECAASGGKMTLLTPSTAVERAVALTNAGQWFVLR